MTRKVFFSSLVTLPQWKRFRYIMTYFMIRFRYIMSYFMIRKPKKSTHLHWHRGGYGDEDATDTRLKKQIITTKIKEIINEITWVIVEPKYCLLLWELNRVWRNSRRRWPVAGWIWGRLEWGGDRKSYSTCKLCIDLFPE